MSASEIRKPSRPRRRVDAERSIARILDAAIDALGTDPEASMGEIARRAGVVRATIYVHFPTRKALIDAITQRSVTDVIAAIEAAEPQRGEPAAALGRVVAAAWRALGRYHPLIAINARRSDADLERRHRAIHAALLPLIDRGRRDGAFRADMSAGWHLSMIVGLVHAASAELRAGRIAEAGVEPALLTTVLGALGARHHPPKEP